MLTLATRVVTSAPVMLYSCCCSGTQALHMPVAPGSPPFMPPPPSRSGAMQAPHSTGLSAMGMPCKNHRHSESTHAYVTCVITSAPVMSYSCCCSGTQGHSHVCSTQVCLIFAFPSFWGALCMTHAAVAQLTCGPLRSGLLRCAEVHQHCCGVMLYLRRSGLTCTYAGAF